MAMADSGEDTSIGGVRAVEKDGCMFLGSDFIEVGILPNGGFGADVTPPANFFGVSRGEIGLYSDVDGFYNDTYDYRYDYFLPGTPEERWSVGFVNDGSVNQASNGRSAGTAISTTITNITDSEAGRVAVDSIFKDKLVINQTYELKPTERFLKVNVTLTNAGSDMMENVRYQRSFDPDNGHDVIGVYITNNTIVNQQGTSNKAIVKAELRDADLSTELGQISSIPIFYYTQDEDARVSSGNSSSGLTPINPPYGELDWDSAPSEGYSVEADTYIAVTFNKSALAPGESVNYTFYIGLTTDIDETISDVEEDAGNPDPAPPKFNSTPEAFFINNDGTSRDVNTNFTFGYSGANISLSTQLDNSSVTAVTANFSNIPGESAGQVPFEYQGEGVFTLLNYTLPDSEPGIYYITILANSSGQMNSTTCPIMLDFNPKTDIAGLGNPNTTDWTITNDLTNVSNLTFEANDSNGNVIGSLEFTENVNLCDIGFAQKLQQFGEYINFATAQTTLDSANLGRLNVSSNLTMRGLESFDNQPGILLNGQPILQTGQVASDTVSGLQWDADNGVLTFSTEHWSTYTADGEVPEVIPNSPIEGVVGPGDLLELNVSVSDTSSVSSVVVNVSSINNTIDEAILSNNNGYWTNNSVVADAAIDGQYYLNINATDAVGNSNSSVNCSVIMDSVPPEIEISGNFTQWQNSSALIDVNLNDDNEIAKVRWDSGNHEASHFETSGNELSSPYDFTVTSNGSYTVYAQDAAGNENISLVQVSKIDTTDAIINFGTNGNSTYSANHSTTVSASDSLSGIEKLEYSWTQTEESAGSWYEFTNGDTLSKEGVDGDWYLHIRATDIAGNINHSVSNVFNFDSNPPVINAVEFPVNTNTGEIVGIGFNVTDHIGITSTDFNISTNDTAELTENGNWYNYTLNVPVDSVIDIDFNATFSDAAGNFNATDDISVNVTDNIDPVIQTTVYEENVNTGQTVVIGFNVNDNIGITSTGFNISTNDTAELTKDGNWYNYTLTVPEDSVVDIDFNATFSDAAGNSNASSDKTINVTDNIAPVIQDIVYEENVNTGDVVGIGFNVNDNIGITSTSFNISTNDTAELAKDGNWYNYTLTVPEDSVDDIVFNATFSDAAGNFNATDDISVNVSDNIKPSYNWFNKVESANTGDNITIKLNATDNIGVETHIITVDGEEYQMVNESGNYTHNISIPASDSGTLVSSITYNCTFVDGEGNMNSTGNTVVDVSILPIADFSANVTRGNTPLSVEFTDNSSGLVEEWNWDFGDGNTSTDQNTSHVFGSGNFNVNLTVNNSNGTSSKELNIRAAEEPVYVVSPKETELLSTYGDEKNFSINSTLSSSYEWFIDGTPLNGSGVTLHNNNTNDSVHLSYCNVNTSQYIDQDDFFMDVYNISAHVSNESIGRTDVISWQWTVTNSSANKGDEIDHLINTTPEVNTSGNESHVRSIPVMRHPRRLELNVASTRFRSIQAMKPMVFRSRLRC
ncbi:PKD domain-containing protein [Methanohalophilus profundi]|uniref:PKD domain-containing protein n=1 Tax=Methanohalophilus profundi TaxID=2138083 RepID=UPI00101B63B9|nr:PKD domain-containing protein [Methanohalophilus profundi]